MWQYNGVTILAGRSWTDDNGVMHPSVWTRWTDEFKRDMGLTWQEQVVPESYDNRFYWSANNARNLEDVKVVDEEGNAVLDVEGNPQIQQGLKTKHIAKAKAACSSKLTPTDWVIIRNQENNKAVPQETLDYRASVRAACNSIETAIKGTTTLEEFKALFDAKYDEENRNLVGRAIINRWPES